MTRAEILDWLEQEQSPVIAFDTNALFGGGSRTLFADLCNVLNRINELRAPQTVQKVLSAAVYMEKMHDMRQEYGKAFQPSLIDNFLATKGIEIISFERQDAEHAAELIGQRYPGRAEWHGFERQRCLDCLGMRQYAEHAQGSGQSCGATTDWLVAGQASGRGHLLVTNDRGPEFRGLARQGTLDALCAGATDLLGRIERVVAGNHGCRG